MLAASFDKTTRPAPSGFAVLFSVLVVSAVGVVLATALVLLGLGASLSASTMERSGQAKHLASGCADEALRRIKDDDLYVGSDSLSFGQGSCSFTVTDTGGQNRLITASGTVGQTVRKVKVTLDQVTPSINMTSWQEVADF